MNILYELHHPPLVGIFVAVHVDIFVDIDETNTSVHVDIHSEVFWVESSCTQWWNVHSK